MRNCGKMSQINHRLVLEASLPSAWNKRVIPFSSCLTKMRSFMAFHKSRWVCCVPHQSEEALPPGVRPNIARSTAGNFKPNTTGCIKVHRICTMVSKVALLSTPKTDLSRRMCQDFQMFYLDSSAPKLANDFHSFLQHVLLARCHQHFRLVSSHLALCLWQIT